MNRIPICMPAYNRPDYLRQVFDALLKCDCLDQFLVCGHVEPGQVEVLDVFYEYIGRLPGGGNVVINKEQLGCNENVKQSIEYGFSVTDASWAVCLEDDIVLAKDALRWLLWANAHYNRFPDCFTICAYQSHRKPSTIAAGGGVTFSSGTDELPSEDKLADTIFRGTLLPWGWSITRDKFETAKHWWDRKPEGRPGLWDDNLCHYMAQRMWYEVCPVVSRAQNIGERGFNESNIPKAYGSSEHWETYQRVHNFIGEVWPDYPVPEEYIPFDHKHVDAFKRTYMRQRGIKPVIIEGEIKPIER